MTSYQDTENKIIGNLLMAPLESKSLLKLSSDTKLTYVTVHKVIPALIKRKLLKIAKKGNSSLVSIDLDNANLEDISSASLYGRNLFFKKYPAISLLVKDVEESLSDLFYILLLFGSYAKGNPKNDSDIDLLFIIPTKKESDIYMEKIKKALRLHQQIKKDLNIASAEDFLDMLDQ